MQDYSCVWQLKTLKKCEQGQGCSKRSLCRNEVDRFSIYLRPLQRKQRLHIAVYYPEWISDRLFLVHTLFWKITGAHTWNKNMYLHYSENLGLHTGQKYELAEWEDQWKVTQEKKLKCIAILVIFLIGLIKGSQNTSNQDLPFSKNIILSQNI